MVGTAKDDGIAALSGQVRLRCSSLNQRDVSGSASLNTIPQSRESGTPKFRGEDPHAATEVLCQRDGEPSVSSTDVRYRRAALQLHETGDFPRFQILGVRVAAAEREDQQDREQAPRLFHGPMIHRPDVSASRPSRQKAPQSRKRHQPAPLVSRAILDTTRRHAEVHVDIGLTFNKTIRMSTGSVPTLPATERLILELLVSNGSMFGLQLVGASGGRLKRGSVYVTLGRMEEKGFVESEQEPRAPGAIGLPRRLYRPTALGERALRAWSMLARELAWEGRP
jgi:PadR family transcriptional regulator, regulatory protein PadR